MANSRIRWLVAAHAILAAGPLLVLVLKSSMELLPLEWAVSALPLGILMTLSVWVGLGRTRFLWRAALGLAAVFYVTIFPEIADPTRGAQAFAIGTAEWIMDYLEATMEIAILFVLLSGAFLLIGRWFEVVPVKAEDAPANDERLQFSMLQIMLVMSVVAVVLSLMRASRAVTGRDSSTWEDVTIFSFLFVCFFVNTACAVFAMLGLGKVRRNVALVLVVAVLLGVVTAVAMHSELNDLRLFAGSMLIMITPAVIVLTSLFVVRTCGYRLVRRARDRVADSG